MKKHMEHNTAATAAAGKQEVSYLKDTQEARKATLVNNRLFIIQFYIFNILKTTSYNRDPKETIQNLLSSCQEYLRTGALVQSTVYFLIPISAVLFKCSFYFPELPGYEMDPCSLSSLMFVSINTAKQSEKNPSLKKNEEQWAGSGKLCENQDGGVGSYTHEPEHPWAIWQKVAMEQIPTSSYRCDGKCVLMTDFEEDEAIAS